MSDMITERLILRAIERSDAIDLLSIYADDKVMFGQSTADMQKNADDILLLIDYEYTHCCNHELLPTVIERKSDEVVLGIISVNQADSYSVDIAYFLKIDEWHHGYMKEALSVYCENLFQKLNIHCITAQCRSDNRQSAAVLNACGFHRLPNREQVLLNDYKYHEAVTYRLCCDDIR